MLYRVRKTFTDTAVLFVYKWQKLFKNFCFSEATGKQEYDHPEFRKIMESLEEYDGIKYSAYRVAFKIYALQKHLRGECNLLTFFLPFRAKYRITEF